MKISERYNIENLRNRSAEKVLNRLESILEDKQNFCHCEECVLDLIAYVLNHVTPLYGTSLLGPLHPNKDKEKKVEIEIDLAIKAGIKKITEHPHHGESQQSEAV
jgi:competence protein ComFB